MFDESEIKREIPVLFILTTCRAHVCVCVAMAVFAPISMFSVQMTDTHYSSLQVGFFMSVALLFLRTCIFFLFVDTKHCIVPWNNEWALNKCNTFKDWTRLKMTIDRQSIRSTLDALALEIVSSHVCAC